MIPEDCNNAFCDSMCASLRTRIPQLPDFPFQQLNTIGSKVPTVLIGRIRKNLSTIFYSLNPAILIHIELGIALARDAHIGHGQFHPALAHFMHPGEQGIAQTGA